MPVPKCVECGAETILLVGGIAVCLKCEEAREKAQAEKNFEGQKPPADLSKKKGNVG